MADNAPDEGVLRILEEPRRIPRLMPEFVLDYSGRGLSLKLLPEQDIHGSYLVRRQNALLFGPNHLVTRNGNWSCESRKYKNQFLKYFQAPFFNHIYPGPKPKVFYEGNERLLRTVELGDADIALIDRQIFLATPLEVSNWGRWLVTVVPKVAQYIEHGRGRLFCCFAQNGWQKKFLKLLGVDEGMILQHDPGRTYVCDDVMTVEYSETNMSISTLERANYFDIIIKNRIKMPVRRKLFVSRMSRSRRNPHYRVLQNEAELAAMLESVGFETVEPESLSFEEQITLFSGAEQVVFLGGSGIYNTVFCAPGTRVVTIESSDKFVGLHLNLLASLGFRYGVVFGKEDPTDTSEAHRRWTVDVPRVHDAILDFFHSA